MKVRVSSDDLKMAIRVVVAPMCAKLRTRDGVFVIMEFSDPNSPVAFYQRQSGMIDEHTAYIMPIRTYGSPQNAN